MPDYPAELSQIAKEHVDAASRALSVAFEAGRALGRKEGRSAFLQEMVSLSERDIDPKPHQVMGPPVPRSEGPRAIAEQSDTPRRAPKGSVRPAILDALRDSDPLGIAPEGILDLVRKAGHTLIKPETIRSTLHKLAGEGLVTKRGGSWFLLAGNGEKENPGAGGSGAD